MLDITTSTTDYEQSGVYSSEVDTTRSSKSEKSSSIQDIEFSFGQDVDNFKSMKLKDYFLPFDETNSPIKKNHSLKVETPTCMATPLSRVSLRNKIYRDTPIFKVPFQENKLNMSIRGSEHSKVLNKSLSRILNNLSESKSTRISRGQAAIMRYLQNKDILLNSNNDKSNEESLDIIELFKIFQYLNDHLVVLNVIDKHDEDGKYSGFNQSYISGYNSLMLPVTFRNFTLLSAFEGVSFYKADNIYTMKTYILKASNVDSSNIHNLSGSGQRLLHEIRLLSKVRHPNIARYHRSWIEYQSLYEQLEYTYGPSINEYIKQSDRESIFHECYMLKIVDNILSAIYYLLDEFNCTHNRIQCRNIHIQTNSIECTDKTCVDDENIDNVSFVLFNFEKASYHDNRDSKYEALDNEINDLRLVLYQMMVGISDDTCVNQITKDIDADFEMRTSNRELISKFRMLKKD